MKTRIYELNFKTVNGWHNLLYTSFKRAYKDCKNDYAIGKNNPFGIITKSYVTERELF